MDRLATAALLAAAALAPAVLSATARADDGGADATSPADIVLCGSGTGGAAGAMVAGCGNPDVSAVDESDLGDSDGAGED
ncbi:hypothetical protein [Marinitenerispora sediminis]|uniref:Uncharacterized protein n=1 Tax=Marinitenerispora sediminis TaxID=1931232 RepID=A0A368T1S0_9ACTN|nr:hypothetical protein [Marinitenerispora sediminis]RCV51568.1 hypothetical protein DEF28_15205 [Marinitenerispora sediminis]RCV54446.1 hypothetical protein DEF24_19245 [Marinitenerispora sediminis]RCV55641.1 hypothetical protein DEF23_14000 [Marinitenerispora sediminis]